MAKIYRFKEDTDFNEIAKIGWDVMPKSDANLTFFKFLEQPKDSELYNSLLNNYYKNEEWIKRVYNKNKKEIINAIGLKYNKNGIMKMNEKIEMVLTMWRLETEAADDFWICLKSADPFDRHHYYNKEVIDKYCAEEIKKLNELGLIEEIEVEENA